MMRINLVMLCILLLVATGEAMGRAIGHVKEEAKGETKVGSWWVGGNIGSARGDTNASDLNNQLTDQGLNATASSDDSRKAWQLFLGYQDTPTWGVELGYVDLGEVDTSISGSVTDINAFLASVDDIHPQTAQGWQLSGVYRYPIKQHIWLVLRGGILDWSSKYKLKAAGASRTVKSSGKSGTYGLGAEMEMNEVTRASINYGRYSVDGESISVLSAGVSYRFK